MATNIPDPVDGAVITTVWGDTVRNEVSALDATRVKRAGDTMTGALILPTITSTNYLAAVHRQYVVDNFLPDAGGTLTGLLVVNPASGDLCIRLRGASPYIDAYNEAGSDRYGYLQFTANGFLLTALGSSGVNPGYISAQNTGMVLYSQADIKFYPDALMSGFMSTTVFCWGKAASDLANAGFEVFGVGSSAEGSVRSTIASTTQNYFARHDGTANANGVHFMSFYRGSTQAGSISQDGTVGVLYNKTSDRRVKNIIGPITDAAERIMLFKPQRVTWKEDPGRGETDAFVADEFATVIPTAVTGEPNAVYTAAEAEAMGATAGEPKLQQLDQTALIPLLTAALQEALSRIDQLTARLDALEGE